MITLPGTTVVTAYANSLKNYGKKLTSKVTSMLKSTWIWMKGINERDVDDIWAEAYMEEYFPVFKEVE